MNRTDDMKASLQSDFEEIPLGPVFKRFKMLLSEAKKVMTQIDVFNKCKLVESFDENRDFIKVNRNIQLDELENIYEDKLLCDLFNTTNKSLIYSLQNNEIIKRNEKSKLIEEMILEMEDWIEYSLLNDERMISLIKNNCEIYYFDYIHILDDETSININYIIFF